MIEIISTQGITRQIDIRTFPAMDGWELQRKFIDFARSTDKEFRTGYIMEVMAYASVYIGDNLQPLVTMALIDNHIETWKNIEIVFNAVLRFNDIDPDTHADQPSFWANAGAEMAISFAAELNRLMGPALKLMAETATE